MSEAYKSAANVYMKANGSWADIPKFHYFTGKKDLLVFQPQATFFTDHDTWEGPVSGDHDTIKRELNSNSSLVRRIVDLVTETSTNAAAPQETKIQLVKAVNTERERAVRVAASGGKGAASERRIDVVLISCSRQKASSPGVEHLGTGGISEQLVNVELWPQIVETRSRILRLVHQGKVNGVEFKEGNRISRRENEELVLGPDFGGALNGSIYLPATTRYTGRCFKNISPEDWDAMARLPNRLFVLVMSGLYGLIPQTELIQNYDVHLTDVDTSSNTSLQSYWKDRDLMTQVLLGHLRWIEREYGPVANVVDALSELSYQETINWGMIYPHWTVLHRVFKKLGGSEGLGNLGFWLRDAVRDPMTIRNLEPNTFYRNDRFIPEDEEIAFETRIGSSTLAVAREIPQ
jgi:hypothetical protein